MVSLQGRRYRVRGFGGCDPGDRAAEAMFQGISEAERNVLDPNELIGKDYLANCYKVLHTTGC